MVKEILSRVDALGDLMKDLLVFALFFTTKARGSGLGLPTAKRIVEAHHGTISIETPPTGGTSVLIHLPSGVV